VLCGKKKLAASMHCLSQPDIAFPWLEINVIWVTFSTSLNVINKKNPVGFKRQDFFYNYFLVLI
jgi:hypothetical protein